MGHGAENPRIIGADAQVSGMNYLQEVDKNVTSKQVNGHTLKHIIFWK